MPFSVIVGQPLNVMLLKPETAPLQLPGGVDDPTAAAEIPLAAFAALIAWASVQVEADGAPVSVTTIAAAASAAQNTAGAARAIRSAAVKGDNDGANAACLRI